MSGTGLGVGGVLGFQEVPEQSLFSKLQTLSRSRRRKQEADELAEEARQAIQDPLNPTHHETITAGYQLAEGEERSMIEAQSKECPSVQELSHILIDWMNTELVGDRILVRDITEDLYDGQILQKLAEKLLNVKINHPEVSQNEMGQKHRLKMVIDEFNAALKVSASYAAKHWPVLAIFEQDHVAIFRLLVALVRRFAPAIRLPRKVQLTVLVVRKINGLLQHRRQIEVITENEDDHGTETDHDAISALVDCAVPEKLTIFQQTLLNFINHHLSKLNLRVGNLETEMNDGVNFILLIGLLGGFFVPLHYYHVPPKSDAQCLGNLQLAFQLAEEVDGITISHPSTTEVARNDLKTVLRLLYSLYTRHKEDA